jgi:hypothetical protein
VSKSARGKETKEDGRESGSLEIEVVFVARVVRAPASKEKTGASHCLEGRAEAVVATRGAV